MSVQIRKWRLTDASDLAAALSNQNVQNNLRDGLPYPYTEQDGRDYISAMLDANQNDTFAFAITVDGKVIGSIGAFRQTNIHHRTAELGYYIAEEYWGKGIMTEAVKLLCDKVFMHTDIIRIYAEPFAHNLGSCRVLEKAGFEYEGTLRRNAVKNGITLDMKMYSLLKSRQNEKSPSFEYRKATLGDLERIWNQNIAENAEDPRWVSWKKEYISYSQTGKAATFVVLCDGSPVGEGTLLFSPQCGAIRGREALADHVNIANINALRICKVYEGQGHISTLVHRMEDYAANQGYHRLTIGVEAKEARNLGIYLHWGYDEFVMSEVEDGELVLYYAKDLKNTDRI